MANWAPPYIGKLTQKLELELLRAEKKELEAKSKLEYATEYKKLCAEKLEEAKRNDEEHKYEE